MINPYGNSRRNRPPKPDDPIRDAIAEGQYTPGVVEWMAKAEISGHNNAMLGKTNDPDRRAEIAATLPNPDMPFEEMSLGTLENAMRSLTLAGVEVPEDDPAYQHIVERVKNGYEPDHLAHVQKSLASYGIRLSQNPGQK